MKKISFDQMIIGLDDLFFNKPLQSVQDGLDRVETIEAYLEGCGWSWNEIIDNMVKEDFSMFDN